MSRVMSVRRTTFLVGWLLAAAGAGTSQQQVPAGSPMPAAAAADDDDARFAALAALRRELGLYPHTHLVPPGQAPASASDTWDAGAVLAAAIDPQTAAPRRLELLRQFAAVGSDGAIAGDADLARGLLAMLDAGEVALCDAAEAALHRLLASPHRSPVLVEMVVAAAKRCWPTDPMQLAVPLVNGTRNHDARVIAVAAGSGDRDLVQRLIAASAPPPADAPPEFRQRADAFAYLVLEGLGRAAPHVDVETARRLHGCFAAEIERILGHVPLLPPWLGGVLHVLLGIYPQVPDELVASYAPLFADLRIRHLARERCRPSLPRMTATRAAPLVGAVTELNDPAWLLQAPQLVIAALVRGGPDAERALELLAVVRAVPAAMWLPLCTAARDLPAAAGAMFRAWLACAPNVPLSARLAALPIDLPSRPASADAEQQLLILNLITKATIGVDDRADIAALLPYRAAVDPSLANTAWRASLHRAIVVGAPLADAATGIALLGANDLLVQRYQYVFAGRQPAGSQERMALLRDAWIVIPVERLREWSPQMPLLGTAMLSPNFATRCNALAVAGELGSWDVLVARLVPGLTTFPDAAVRAAAYAALRTRDPAVVPAASLFDEVRFDESPIVRALAVGAAVVR